MKSEVAICWKILSFFFPWNWCIRTSALGRSKFLKKLQGWNLNNLNNYLKFSAVSSKTISAETYNQWIKIADKQVELGKQLYEETLWVPTFFRFHAKKEYWECLLVTQYDISNNQPKDQISERKNRWLSAKKYGNRKRRKWKCQSGIWRHINDPHLVDGL